MFQGYTRAGLQIGAADFKQMEKNVDRNVSEAPAFAACMRCIVSVHCLCTSSRLQVPACNDPTSPCRGHCHTRVCAEWLYWVQALINIRSVCKAALSGAAETEKEKVFVDLQKRGEDKTVLFGGPIFWACAVAADTESDTVFELVCQIPTYIDTPSNKKALDMVYGTDEYARFCKYLEQATRCLEVKTSKIIEKHKQYVLTQQLGMLPKGGPEDHDGSFASLRAELTSESRALLEAAVSDARYEAVTRRRPAMAILANHDAASATGNSGGEAASGGGNTDGADAERDAENGVVMS